MPMYNAEAKRAFIKSYMSNSQADDARGMEKLLEKFFERLGVIETDFDLDIASADYETAMIMVGLLGKGGGLYFSNLIGKLRSYITWSINTSRTHNTENPLDGVRFYDLDKSAVYMMSMIKDEQQLAKYLDVVFDDMRAGTMDIIYRIYALMTFQGVEPSMVQHLMADSVDYSQKTVSVEGRIIKISDYTVEHLLEANAISEYVTNAGIKRNATRKKSNTGHLVETSSYDRKHINTYFMAALSKAAKRYKEILNSNKASTTMQPLTSLTSGGIYKSGIFYRAYKNEVAAGELNLDEIFLFKPNPSTPASDARRLNEKKLISAEYVQWKTAFGL